MQFFFTLGITFIFVSLYLTTLVSFSKLLPRLNSPTTLTLGLIALYSLIAFLLYGFFNYAKADDKRIHIAVIDTGANIPPTHTKYLCNDDSHLDLTGNNGLQDTFGHGTNIAGILAKAMNPRKHCLQIIKWVHDAEDMATAGKQGYIASNYRFGKALVQALKYKAKYVNMSYGGPEPLSAEYLGIQELLNSGAILSIAAGNNSQNLDSACNYYPACYNIKHKNFHVVGNRGAGSSNYGKRITDWAHGIDIEGFGVVMTGTSQATAVYLGGLIK